MDDKNLMENLLVSVKGATGMYLTSTVESADANIRGAFDSALTRSLQMQNEIYQKMSERGWYQNTQAEQQKIDQTHQKFANKG